MKWNQVILTKNKMKQLIYSKIYFTYMYEREKEIERKSESRFFISKKNPINNKLIQGEGGEKRTKDDKFQFPRHWMTLTLLWLTSPWTLKVQVSSSSSMLVMPCTCLACCMLAPWVPMARPIKSSRTRNSSVYPDRILVLWGGKFHEVNSWPVKLPNLVT